MVALTSQDYKWLNDAAAEIVDYTDRPIINEIIKHAGYRWLRHTVTSQDKSFASQTQSPSGRRVVLVTGESRWIIVDADYDPRDKPDAHGAYYFDTSPQRIARCVVDALEHDLKLWIESVRAIQ